MTIKHFDQYLNERNKSHTLPVSALAESRLGIDASHYLRVLLESPETREPFLAATGGLPLALSAKIEADLRALDKFHIKPVFVFPGLLPTNKLKPTAGAHIEACRDRKDAWDCYERGETDEATKLFETRSNVSQWDLWRSVLRIFKQRNVDFVVAPYVSWAQLIYLQRHPKNYIHAVYASTDALLYPSLDKLITSLDLSSPNPTFTYITKSDVLSDLSLTEEQFLDAGILAGFDHSQTFPPFQQERSLKPVVDILRHHKSGFAAVTAMQDLPGVKQTHYIEHFARTRSMIKFSLILSADGLVQPLPLAISPATHPSGGTGHHTTQADIPRDLEDIFTHHLPEEIYYYLSRGLLGPQALIWLTSGQIIENPPLDNGETTEYRRFIKDILTEGPTGPRAAAVGLISSVLHPFWATRKIQPWFWFDPQNMSAGKVLSHSAPPTVQLVERIGNWAVTSAVVEEELRRQNSSTIDFALCLGATSSDKLANRTRTRKDANQAPPHLDKKDEVVANVIWRFLELRGFLVHTHIHSPLGRAMSAGLKHCKVNDRFQDSLFLFLELVRGGVLHGNLWSQRAYSGGPSFGTDLEKRNMLLVMRVLSIVPLQFKPQSWTGPLSRELLVFNGFVRAFSRSLRTLVELTVLNMLLQRHARRARDDLLEIALSLPFQADVNTGFGILAKVYLDALAMMFDGKIESAEDEGLAECKDTALDICEETFEGIKNPRAEVERGFRFWDAVMASIRSMARDQAINDLSVQFEAADTWLRAMRP